MENRYEKYPKWMEKKEFMDKPDWRGLMGEAPDWYRDMKFGLFFHWGPYCVPGFQNEWYSRNMYMTGTPENTHHVGKYGPVKEFGYKEFYNGMTGEAFDPEEWAELVVRSGAKYAGPVTEHADNFSMWDSAVNPVNCKNYGPKRDILGECARAFRNRGIRLSASFHHQWLWGWFMSTDPEADVYVPGNEVYYGPALPLETGRMYPYRLPDSQFCDVWLQKVSEVIDRYSPDILYFDSRTCIIGEEYRYRAASYFYEKKGRENGVITYKGEDFPPGTAILDVERGHFEQATPFVWQTDDRLEDNITWCYVNPPRYRKAEDVIHQLIRCVAHNGSLLLNVGPDARGAFPPEAKRTLYEIGGWLSVNGEAIYRTRPWKTTEEENCCFTQSEKGVYAIFFKWPDQGELILRSFNEPGIRQVRLLGCELQLTFSSTPEGLKIILPKKKPCKHAWTVSVCF